jgi:two-component system sensor histidine kinase QseC
MNVWQRNYSLRQRVLAGLFIATLVYWSAIAALTFDDNIDEVHELYDIHLAHTALALLRVNVAGVEDASTPITGEVATGTIKQLFQKWPDLPQRLAPGEHVAPGGTSGLNSDIGLTSQIVERNVDHGLTLRYQLWANDGHLLFRSINAPLTAMTEELGFSIQVDPNGKVWRNYSIWDANHLARAVVSEGDKDRMKLVRSISIKSTSPILLGMPVFILLLWLSVKSGLGPLTELSKAISRRDATSLVPLDDSKSPRELLPIVLALNNLIGRMKQTLENERRFNANAAHELNTPLAAIQAHLYVARHTSNESERQQALDQAQAGIARNIRLVGQMLAMARIENRLEKADTTSVNLAEIAQNVCAELGPLALKRDQTLALVNAPEPMLMTGNADLLHRLIANLVDNAIRYAATGGEIRVEVARTPTSLRLTVQDDGPGIPAEHLDRVFDRYYRLADKSRIGTGLGLAICRTIADIHLGKISLAQGPGGRGLVVACEFQVSETDPISQNQGSRKA